MTPTSRLAPVLLALSIGCATAAAPTPSIRAPHYSSRSSPDFFGVARVSVVHTGVRETANSDAFVRQIRDADAVWLSGGNAGRLADAYLDTRVQAELRALLQRDGVIGGNSAGAIIQGSFIVRGRPDKPVLMAPGRTMGFGFLPGVAVNPHLPSQKRENELVTVIDAHPELLGIGISDSAGVVVRSGVLEPIGDGRVAIYDNERHGCCWYYFLGKQQRFDLMTRRVRDSTTATELATRFDSLRRAIKMPGLAVVMMHDTTVLLAQGFGVANIERNTPVTPETPFNTASVSKPISAVVALRLVQDGLLDLDRPMQRYKGFDEFCREVRGAGGVFFSDYACVGDRLTLRHVLSMTANGEPGGCFFYNPPSYSWASRPMAEVAGRQFSDLVDSLVFRPAAMTHAARIHRRLPLRADLAAILATPYHVDSTGRVVQSEPPGPQGDGAAGGVIASAMDLARFDIALSNDRLLTPASRAKLWTPARTASGKELPYGLGWFLGEYNGRRLAWHTGLWEGQYSALYLKVLDDARAERFTLILLANSDGLRWPTRLDEAAIERSPFAVAFLDAFPPPR